MEKRQDTHIIEFKGSAQIKDKKEYEKSIKMEWIPELNEKAEFIANSIKNDIKKNLPPGLSIDVQIEFFPGSIEWAGVVLIMDWMARLSGSLGLIDYLVKAVKVSVNRTVRNELRYSMSPNMQNTIQEVNTDTFITSPQEVQQSSNICLLNDKTFLLLTFNTILLIIIVVLILTKIL